MSWIDVPLLLEERDSNAQAITCKEVCITDSQRLVNFCKKDSALALASFGMQIFALPRHRLILMTRFRKRGRCNGDQSEFRVWGLGFIV